MSNIIKAESLWTCDRCGTKSNITCLRPEDPSLPRGWKWMALDSDSATDDASESGEDWCPACVSSYKQWHAGGKK